MRKRSRSSSSLSNHLACNGTLQVTYNQGDFIVRQVGQGDFEDGLSTDYVDLVVHFRPPLLKATGTLTLQYTGTKHVERPLLWSQRLEPLDQGVPLILRENELEYRCYPTYCIHVKDNKILALYLNVENAATTALGGAYDLQLQVHYNQRLHFLPARLGSERARFLPWFPPDVDPAQWGLRLDPRRIPQRTPLWFKLRGDVSGSRAYSFLGWFVSNAGKPMTAFQKSAMRLGSFSEDLILLAYCYQFPNRTFEEVGWCPAPGHPIGWGASPDGIIHDPDMNWDKVPEKIAAQYESQKDSINITRGACEFKTSRTKLVVEPYFLAQVYMEMISLETIWCDLVRYRPSRSWNDSENAWQYHDEAHVYRIFRDKEMEARLIPLWKHAYVNQHVLEKVAKEAAYVKIRADLEDMARKEEPYAKIEVEKHPELEKLFAEVMLPTVLEAAVEEEEEEDDLNSRHQKIMKTEDASTFIQLVAAQMRDYSDLLSTLDANHKGLIH